MTKLTPLNPYTALSVGIYEKIMVSGDSIKFNFSPFLIVKRHNRLFISTYSYEGINKLFSTMANRFYLGLSQIYANRIIYSLNRHTIDFTYEE